MTNMDKLMNKHGGYKSMGVVLRNRKMKGGFLQFLAPVLASALSAGIGRLIKGKGLKKGRKGGCCRKRKGGSGVMLSGDRRGGSFLGKLKNIGKTLIKNQASNIINKIKNDPVGSLNRAIAFGKKAKQMYDGAGMRGRGRRAPTFGVHTSAPGSKTVPTISKHKLTYVPVKTLTVKSLKNRY